MEEPNSNSHFLLQIRWTSQQTNINLLIRLAGTVFKLNLSEGQGCIVIWIRRRPAKDQALRSDLVCIFSYPNSSSYDAEGTWSYSNCVLTDTFSSTFSGFPAPVKNLKHNWNSSTRVLCSINSNGIGKSQLAEGESCVNFR